MGLNYKWGANPLQWGDAVPVASVVNNPPPRNWLAGWDAEGGVRYFGSWGRFQKDIGSFANSGVPGLSAVSRFTYADMQTNSGELFARIDSPWRLFVKGFVGTGATNGGPMNDEDFGIPARDLRGLLKHAVHRHRQHQLWCGRCRREHLGRSGLQGRGFRRLFLPQRT